MAAGLVDPSHLLSGDHLSAVCSPLEVAIGVCITYLGFDRFRYHQRAHKLLEKFSKKVADPADMLSTIAADGLTVYERDFLACLYHCGGAEMETLIEPYKKDVFDGEFMKTIHGAIMSWVLKHTLDRKLVQLMLVLLCVIQIGVAWVLYTQDYPPQWMSNPVVGNGMFCIVLAAFLIPATAFAVSEHMLKNLNAASERWVRDEKTRGERNAKNAGIAGVDRLMAEPGS